MLIPVLESRRRFFLGLGHGCEEGECQRYSTAKGYFHVERYSLRYINQRRASKAVGSRLRLGQTGHLDRPHGCEWCWEDNAA